MFGAAYQFLNSGSGKTLKVTKTTSESEATAFQVALEDEGCRSKALHFRIRPGFRIRQDAEAIRMGDTVVLQSISQSTRYLHTSTEGGAEDVERAEVNCFETATRFKIVPVRFRLSACLPARPQPTCLPACLPACLPIRAALLHVIFVGMLWALNESLNSRFSLCLCCLPA